MNLMINYHDHWWYKALTWLLIVAIIIMISIGAAPPARAIGVLTATMAAAILAVLAGAGIYTVVSGMTSAQIQSWLNEKLNQWDTYRNDGNVFSDLIQNNLIAATVRGTLGIGAAAASAISDFISWLKNDTNLTNNNTTLVYSDSNYKLNVNYGYRHNPEDLVFSDIEGDLYIVSNYSNVEAVAYIDGNNYRIMCISDKQANVTIYKTYAPYGNINSAQNNTLGLYYDDFRNVYYSNNLITFNSYYVLNTKIYPSYNDALLSLGTMGNTLSLNTDVINIPDTTGDKVIGLEVGAFPGATTEEITDVILDGVIDNTLDVDMVVTDELVDAQEVYIINEQPLSVNTDHHAFGFQLPEITFDFSSIWHYVTDAVTYASGFISWWVSFFTSVPILTIPLYCAFTLLVVLGAMRRFLL